MHMSWRILEDPSCSFKKPFSAFPHQGGLSQSLLLLLAQSCAPLCVHATLVGLCPQDMPSAPALSVEEWQPPGEALVQGLLRCPGSKSLGWCWGSSSQLEMT